MYEPLIGASREWQVVPGTNPTALLAGVGTTKVSAHRTHTPHARLDARDRKSARYSKLGDLNDPVSLED